MPVCMCVCCAGTVYFHIQIKNLRWFSSFIYSEELNWEFSGSLNRHISCDELRQNVSGKHKYFYPTVGVYTQFTHIYLGMNVSVNALPIYCLTDLGWFAV